MKHSTIDMTKGNVFKVILSFGFPLFIENLFHLLYSFVDTIIAARFIGDVAIGAIELLVALIL